MSAGAGKHTASGGGYVVMATAAMVILSWIGGAHLIYAIPHDQILLAYWYTARAMLDEPRLWVLPVISLLSGLAMLVSVKKYYHTGFGGGAYLYKLRGPDMASPARLKDMALEKNKLQLSIADIPIPTEVESMHMLVIGATGAGKTQAIAGYIESAMARGGRIICVDPNGGYMRNFYQEGDVILNPFDARGMYWSIFHEIVNAFDVAQFAVTMIPRAAQTEQEQWNSMARMIVSELMLKLVRNGHGSTGNLTYWLMTASNDELQAMLSDTGAAGMFHNADETVGSVRAILTRFITPHKYLTDAEPGEKAFSIRDWLASGSGNLWITWREDMLQSLAPLISCWTDVACAAALSTDLTLPDKRAVHLVIDEADSLEPLHYVIPVATKGRKHNLYLSMGFQSFAQLDDKYGVKGAMSLRGCLRTTVALAISEGDTYTSEQISIGFGSHEVVRSKKSTSKTGGNTTLETIPERLVTQSEINQLPNLTGYLKFPGEWPLVRIKIKHREREQLIEPLRIIENKWTRVITAPKSFLAGALPGAIPPPPQATPAPAPKHKVKRTGKPKLELVKPAKPAKPAKAPPDDVIDLPPPPDAFL